MWFPCGAAEAATSRLCPRDNAWAGPAVGAGCSVLMLQFWLLRPALEKAGFKSPTAFGVTPPLFRLLAPAATRGPETQTCEAREGALPAGQAAAPIERPHRLAPPGL